MALNLHGSAVDTGAMKPASLIPHPATPVAFPLHIEASVTRLHDGEAMAFRFTLRGDLARVRIPAPAAGKRQDGLWRHTCFEAFIRGARGDAYVEMNFSPSTDWACYRFTAYRDGMAPLPMKAAPRLSAAVDSGGLMLRAEVPLDALRTALPHIPWHLALSAVVETVEGTQHYWALAHPPGKPDFHHDAGFVMSLGGINP